MRKNKGLISSSEKPSIRWGTKRRLSFIDFRLQWEGRINRVDLVDAFQISVPQASKDLAAYRKLAPKNLRYDRNAKCYFATAGFRPRFGLDSADEYLNQLMSVSMGVRKLEDSFLAWRPQHDSVRIPERRVSQSVLKALLEAIRSNLVLKCTYQSMSHPEPRERLVSPIALASNGFRWHVRAFCHQHNEFRDFVCSRVTDAAVQEPSEIDPIDDKDWFHFVDVRIGPDPRLSENQRKMIEYDYEMVSGQREYSVRAALLFYFIKNLGLEERPADYPAKWQQIILLNRNELIAELGPSAIP